MSTQGIQGTGEMFATWDPRNIYQMLGETLSAACHDYSGSQYVGCAVTHSLYTAWVIGRWCAESTLRLALETANEHPVKTGLVTAGVIGATMYKTGWLPSFDTMKKTANRYLPTMESNAEDKDNAWSYRIGY